MAPDVWSERLALSSFLASAANTTPLQENILPQCNRIPYRQFTEYAQTWSDLHACDVLHTSSPHWQSVLDRPDIERDKATVWNSANEPTSKGRLTAVTAPHSGDWAPHCSSFLMWSQAWRRSHSTSRGPPTWHRPPRNSQMPCCSMFPSPTAFPVGLDWSHISHAGQCQHPSQQLSLKPWQSVKAFLWYVTVTHAMANSCFHSREVVPGHAAELAAIRKTDKYNSLTGIYTVHPLAFETMGPINGVSSSTLN